MITSIKTLQLKQIKTKKIVPWMSTCVCNTCTYWLSLAFTSAPFSTRSWQISKLPLSQGQCSEVLPLRIPKSKGSKQNTISRVNAHVSMCRAGGGEVRTVLNLLYLRLLPFLRETGKFPGDLQVMRKTTSWVLWKHRNQTVKRKKHQWWENIRRAACRTEDFLHLRLLPFQRETGKFPNDL